MPSRKSLSAGLSKSAVSPPVPATAPVSPPALGNMVLQRGRLHALIDERLPGAVWLHGPTGAGKTLLLRSWLQRDRCPSIWLTVDERHRDPAALFAAITSLAAPHCEGSLPVFSPEHAAAPAAFARGFFARLDKELAESWAFVVDDVHHLVGATASLFASAIDGFAGHRKLCFASQLMPEPGFAPQLASSRLWIVGHKLLAFNVDEAGALADRLGSRAPMLDALVEATDGWAAGLMLAMQFGTSGGPESGSTDPLATVRTPLALLIAAQVLGGVAKDDLVRLRLLAELPQVPMDLADVAPAWTAACSRLQELSERGLFVERLALDRRPAGTEPSTGRVTRFPKGCWRLHDLFRNALKEPGAIGEPDQKVGQELIDHLLEVDRLDLAWQLAAKLGAERLAVLVSVRGSAALRDSHLLGLLQMTQPHVDRAMPSIAIWQARALIGNDSAAALVACDEAFAGFVERGDEAGVALSVALALFVVFAAIENVGAMAIWADRMKVIDRNSVDAVGDAEQQAIRIAGEVVYDLLVGGRALENGADDRLQDRLMTHVSHQVLSPNETILAGSLLVAALSRFARIDEAELAIVRVEELTSYRRAAPHIRASWNVENGYHLTRFDEPERARAYFQQAVVLAEENDLQQPRIDAWIGLVRLEFGLSDTKSAHELLVALEAIGSQRLGRQRGWVTHLRARHEALAGRATAALGLMDRAEQLIIEAGFPDSVKAILDKDRVQILYAAGRFGDSAALAEHVIANGFPVDGRRIEVTRGLIEVHALWHEDRERAEKLLVSHIEAACELQLLGFANLLPEVASHSAAEALRLNVRSDFVTRAIKSRNLTAPRNAPAAWPWPLRVEVLRAFRISKDGIPITFSGKAQQKPLELLKYLACTRDLIADSSSVAAALWPDAEEPAARKSLEVTISRMRKLLDDESFVVVKEGKVALDQRRVSSDARDFGDAVAEVEGIAAGQHGKSRAVELGDRLLRLFGELPLEHEEPTPWREAVRERHRTAFVRAARVLIAYWESAGDSARVIVLIEAALAREPLAENLYRILMKVHLDAGNATEAMRVYRQCRQMLSILIGAQPSVETERLKNSIQL